MDYFEAIIKTLLEHEGYWVRQSFKVNLTKAEKRSIGKPSTPRPEIDLLAYKPATKEVIALEAKSFLDSPGVRLEELTVKHKITTGRYKLFTNTKYRAVVFHRLKIDLEKAGMTCGNVSIRLGLAAGKVYRRRSDEVRSFMDSKGWFFLSPEDIRQKLEAMSKKGYEDEPAIITAKILLR